MDSKQPEFGVLTLATPNDYLKAIGLALSLRVSNPGVPTAIACSAKVKPLVEPFFDQVIEEKAGLRGFVHKVYLDHYSPFKETMFFDSDVLVFRKLRPYLDSWGNGPYCACGGYMTGGVSSFGLDRAAVLKKIAKPRLVVIDGAGHALFRKPACNAVFDLAREITADYKSYAGDIRYADEDVMNIALTMLDLPPGPEADYFHARYLSARPGTMRMDATRGVCSFIASDPKLNGRKIEPYVVHFADNEAPFAYTVQLVRLFRKFNLPIGGLLKLGAGDLYQIKVRNPLGRQVRRFKGLMAA
ncbi:MAG: hypothetical protein KF891_17630 [Rhizobacter sp.]|nr:hypothetical protein [Rhizobacter sp.]